MMKKMIPILLAVLLIIGTMAACNGTNTADSNKAVSGASEVSATPDQAGTSAQTSSSGGDNASGTSQTDSTSKDVLTETDFFSERDMKQTADTSDATKCTLTDNQDLTISSAGVYVISGTANNASIIVDAGDDDKVQLVLSGVTITNSSAPAVYVKNADKVFVTTASGTVNQLSVSGTFTADGTTKTDAVIFSKDDLTINGTGTLNITSSDNGISGKDDVKITGGTISITSAADAIEANDSIRIADGTITITSQKDGLHAENDEDDSTGYIYISGGKLTVTAASDSIQGTSVVRIDGGTMNLTSSEGIEATYVQINGGTIDISASDDGINGSNKSSAYQVTVEITGGKLTINMGQGDTDAIDSNGNLYIKGGEINITAQSPFDYDGEGKLSGGTVIVNGSETTELTNQMMGGGPGGGPDGGIGGGMGGPGGMRGDFNR